MTSRWIDLAKTRLVRRTASVALALASVALGSYRRFRAALTPAGSRAVDVPAAPPDSELEAPPGPRSFSLSALVLRFRWPIVVAWVAAGTLAVTLLPALEESEAAPLGGLVPDGSAALEVARRSAELFRFPVLADTAVVQRDPDGLSTAARARVYERAARLTREPDPDALGIALLLPITNTPGLFPVSREQSTAAVTYLFVLPDRTLRNRADLAGLFAFRYVNEPDDALVGVTGVVPAQLAQFRLINMSLFRVEAATVAVLAVIVAISFRALLAPVVTLLTAGIAFVVASRSIAAVGRAFDFAVPREVEPLLVVLLLAIVADYCIFFLSDFRDRLRSGEERSAAALGTTSSTGRIVLVAGLIVAAGTASLLAGQLSFFRVFGPGLALTAIIGALVSVTLVPALLSILGAAIFWPNRLGAVRVASKLGERARTSGARMTRFALNRPTLTLTASAALLLAGAASFVTTSLGLTLIRGLPADSEPRRAAVAASQGFAPGILSPTELLVEAPGIVSQRVELARLETAIERQRGVAAVLGPREIPIASPLGAALSPTGNAARMLIVLETAPLSGPGIERLRTLERRLPALLSLAGLDAARAGFTGATAFAKESVDSTLGDLRRIGIVAGLVNLLLLVVFLRALVAPLYLLLTSLLALAASLGLTTLVFQHLLGYGDITYYVPFIAAVLLVSLGSDYNVFVVGRIWEAARDRPLREAVGEVAPQAARAIAPAGLALAASFALLAIVPLRPFRELGFALCVGVLLETFVIRSLLVPALIAVFGPWSRWPSRPPYPLAQPVPPSERDGP